MTGTPLSGEGPFDVFVSLAGPDRPVVRILCAELEALRLRIFVDERNIQPYQSITEEIEHALQHSKALLAYYSRHYADRPACQYELTMAFLAGLREGDPTRRIMVVNPHEETDHLQPDALAEAKFDRLPRTDDRATLTRLAERIKARVARIDGYIGGVPAGTEPRWYGRTPGAVPFVGRYREMWALHSALHRHEFRLTQGVSAGGLAVLSGMPGIGKSMLAAAYAWRFGNAYHGGVYWVSLSGSGSDPDELAARFADEVRVLAQLRAWDLGTATGDEALGRFADHLATEGAPCLLVVDDVPGELTAATIRRLTVPAGNVCYTVLVTNRSALDSLSQLVEVGPMALSDSVETLRLYRAGSDAEVLPLAKRLDGHPVALTLAGQSLRDRNGYLTYTQFLARLQNDGSALGPVTQLLRDRILALGEPERKALRLALVCAPAALPVVLLERVLGTDLDDAVIGLRDRVIATRYGTAWQIHALVRDAAREFLPTADLTAPARTAAAAVLDIIRAGDIATPADLSLLVQHAGHIGLRGDLPADLTDALLRRAVDHYDGRGEPLLALPFHVRLAQRHPDDASVLIAAARACQGTGAPDEARRYAEQGLTVTDDPTLRRACLRWAAEAMDSMGSTSEADPLWQRLLADPGSDRIEIELANARALRLRGRHMEAKRRLAALIDEIGTDAALFHEAQTAQIELAQAELDTDGQASARRRAFAVLSAYRERRMAGHRNAVEAGRVFADARLTLALWDLRTDPSIWANAAEDLRALRDWYAATHGPRNLLTLTTAVSHALALIALGRPGDARRAVEAVHDDMLARLGSNHPVYFQAEMVLGYVAAQCGKNERAKAHFEVAYEGQRALLGPTHPHTLRSQLGLAVALKLTGDSSTARRMFAEVRRAAPASVGRGTDIFGQAFVASLLEPLPTGLWRLLAARHKTEDGC